MRKHLSGRRRLVALGVAVAAAAAVATAALAGGFDSGSTPSFARVEINGVAVLGASYQIDGTTIPPKGAKGTTTQDYTVRITAPVTNDTTLLQAFQAGQIPGDVVITLFDVEGQEVVRYDFASAADVSYHQTGDHAAGFEQDLVFKSSSLTVS